jgi:NifU-like protein involved in Fe-S cluster formation
MVSAALYTPQILELATSQADYGWDQSMPLQATARSRSCGSSLQLGLSIDAQGGIERVALKSQACAIGQAAAAIFARGAQGRSAADIQQALAAMRRWLAGAGPQPEWPGLDAIAPARDYPGRHGAILLAWQAADEALSSGKTPR